MKPYLLPIIIVFLISCRSSRPEIDNISTPDSPFANSELPLGNAETVKGVDDTPGNLVDIYTGQIAGAKMAENQSILSDKPRANVFKRIFKPALKWPNSKKVKLKNVTIVNQNAGPGATIGAVTTDAPKKTIAKDKVDEKLKGQNAIKGDNNKAEASKSDKSLLMAVGIGILVSALFLFFWLRRKSRV